MMIRVNIPEDFEVKYDQPATSDINTLTQWFMGDLAVT